MQAWFDGLSIGQLLVLGVVLGIMAAIMVFWAAQIVFVLRLLGLAVLDAAENFRRRRQS